ncbi:Rtf2 RING-finger-domain-containing protein [Infundibulicybe gibba]|nr:Rtf2 RING-finger-domain-containing protein [Infundibulicybe gibba]
MGNDGGSIPDRRDLVRNKPKAEQADKANQTRARWFFCALSKRKLQEPIVSCALGKLYNKDSIIEYLLDNFASLKDVKTLTLTPNSTPSAPATTSSDERPQFVCPLTLKEMNGVQPFIYLSTCGCRSSTEKGGDELDLCPQCAKKFSRSDDIVHINPSAEEEEVMRATMDRRRLLEPVKKTKKRKNAATGEETEPPSKKRAQNQLPSTNPSVAAASRAVVSSLAMEEAKRKAGMSDAVKSLYGDGKQRKETFMTMGTFTRITAVLVNGEQFGDGSKEGGVSKAVKSLRYASGRRHP